MCRMTMYAFLFFVKAKTKEKESMFFAASDQCTKADHTTEVHCNRRQKRVTAVERKNSS